MARSLRGHMLELESVGDSNRLIPLSETGIEGVSEQWIQLMLGGCARFPRLGRAQ